MDLTNSLVESIVVADVDAYAHVVVVTAIGTVVKGTMAN